MTRGRRRRSNKDEENVKEDEEKKEEEEKKEKDKEREHKTTPQQSDTVKHRAHWQGWVTYASPAVGYSGRRN